MDRHIFQNNILNHIKFDATESQKKAIDKLYDFLCDRDHLSTLIIKGYAGTGKTTLIRSIVHAFKEIGINTILMASTGRAAKTLSLVSQKTALTIHRQIYTAEDYGVMNASGYAISPNKYKNTIFIVDEASMIGKAMPDVKIFGSGDLLRDLISYVYSGDGCRLIIVGDTAQLPPVGETLSQALDNFALENLGLRTYDVSLTDVVRQSFDSGILYNATLLRETISNDKNATDENTILPISIKTKQFNDITILNQSEIVDTIYDAFRIYGQDNCLIVCLSNKSALIHNQGVRNKILDYEEPLVRGERLIVSKNNYHYTKRRDRSDFIANGEMIEIQRIIRRQHIYDMDFVDADIYLPDREEEKCVKLLMSSITTEKAQLSQDERLLLFNKISEDYTHIKSRKSLNKEVIKNEFWGALEVKYGYAVTAHKAQGGQWSCVFVDMRSFAYLTANKQMLRWLYTALTRAKEKVYLINCPEEFIKK